MSTLRNPERGRSGLLKKHGAPRAKHNQGFDGAAAVTKVSVNIKIDVQRVRLNLCKSGLGSAYRARVYWLEHGAGYPDNTCSFSSLDAASGAVGDTRSAGKPEHSQQERTKIPGHSHNSRGSRTRARTLIHGRLWPRSEKRSTLVILRPVYHFICIK
jgi:hypothetical protein